MIWSTIYKLDILVMVINYLHVLHRIHCIMVRTFPFHLHTVYFQIAVRKDIRGKTFEMCSLSSKTVNAWQHSGKWSPTTKLKPKTENIFNNVFVDFGNSTIKVAAVEVCIRHRQLK